MSEAWYFLCVHSSGWHLVLFICFPAKSVIYTQSITRRWGRDFLQEIASVRMELFVKKN